jgi:hypothetical protein
MWKYVALLALVLGGTIGVAIHDKRAAEESTPKAASTCDSTVPEPDENQPQKNIQNADWYLPILYAFFRWPGATETWIIVLTLLAVAEQAHESAKATKAMKRSIEVQEAEFLQWLEIGEWEIKSDAVRDFENPREIDVRIKFSVLNNTKQILTICRVRTNLQMGPAINYLGSEKKDIPPKGSYSVLIDTKLTAQQVDAFFGNLLFISANIRVEYENALKKSDMAEFQTIIMGGKDRIQTLSKGYISKVESENDSQNPN